MLIKTPFRAICLCISLFFYSFPGWSQDCSDPVYGVIIDLGQDLNMIPGQSLLIQSFVGSTTFIEDIEWSPSNVDCIDSNCFDVSVSPTVNTCYTVTMTNAAGCTGSDEICVFVEICEDFIANSLIEISPDNPSDVIELKLEIMRTQLFSIEILQNSDIVLETRRFLHKGPNDVSINISSLASGAYQLNLHLFPEPITSSFTKQ